jgi:hypothetical protein
MILQDFSVDGFPFEYGKLEYDSYNLLFVIEGVSDSEFVRIETNKIELDLFKSNSKRKETWQKPKNVKASAVETPLEPIASACAALASATPASTTVSAMTDTVPAVKRGRGRPRKVVQ